MAEETKSACPEGSWPALKSDHAPKGEIVSFDGIQIYAVSPAAASTKGVIIVHDVHGPDSGRTKAICDQLADEGYHVALPDMYEGQTITGAGGFGNPDGMAWLKTIDRPRADMYLDKSLAYLASKGVADGNVGMAGFCWGGWIAAHCAGTGKFKASVGLHPSIKLESMLHGGSQEDLCAAVKTPLMLLPAGNDADNTKPGGELIKIMEPLAEVVSHEYPDMVHGWAIRGDLTDDKVARDVKAAYLNMLGFLNKHVV